MSIKLIEEGDSSSHHVDPESSYSNIDTSKSIQGPRSPMQKFGRTLMSPARYVGSKFKPGGMKGSVFSLITAILGSGTITLPYLANNNGIIIAIVLILFGATISYFCGMLLVKCADKVGSDKYEDFAMFCYGRKMALVTGWSNVSTLLGFVVSYIVFIKTLIPHIVGFFIEGELPELIGNGKWSGQVFWAALYTFLVLTPLSIPREIGALRFNSMFGVCCSFYLVMCLVFMFFIDRGLVPSINDSLHDATWKQITFDGLIDAIPFVVFAFMYQPNIPIIYRELRQKNYTKMNTIVVSGSCFVVVLYILACVFGYLGLVNNPEFLKILNEKSNILEVPYTNWGFRIAIIGLVFAIFAAAPICVLPAKDAFEEIVYPDKGMNMKQNVITTIIMTSLCFVCAVVVPGIGDIITILGCTTNPLIGFILPIIFYLKIVDNVPTYQKVLCCITLVFIIVVSIASFVLFVKGKIED